jgi:hypothetical protein
MSNGYGVALAPAALITGATSRGRFSQLAHATRALRSVRGGKSMCEILSGTGDAVYWVGCDVLSLQWQVSRPSKVGAALDTVPARM